MTPLAQALRRLADAAHPADGASVEASGGRAEAPAVGATVVIHVEAPAAEAGPALAAGDPLPAKPLTAHADTLGDEDIEQVVKESLQSATSGPSNRPSNRLLDRPNNDPPAPAPGVVRLFCDAADDDGLAYLAAAQTSDLVVHLATDEPGGWTTAAGGTTEQLPSLNWPGGRRPALLARTTSVVRVRLPIAAGPLPGRDWVLFLDDCRSMVASTTIVADASLRSVVDWLAARCDEVAVLAADGSTDAGRVLGAAAQLRLASPRPPRCVLVKAA